MERSKRQVKPPKKFVEEDGGPLTGASFTLCTASSLVQQAVPSRVVCLHGLQQGTKHPYHVRHAFTDVLCVVAFCLASQTTGTSASYSKPSVISLMPTWPARCALPKFVHSHAAPAQCAAALSALPFHTARRQAQGKRAANRLLCSRSALLTPVHVHLAYGR